MKRDVNRVLATDQIIYGLRGTRIWIRRKVWFWQRREMERCGWYRSNEPGLPRRIMIYRADRPNPVPGI